MKKITTAIGKFGPYESVEVLDDRYRVDGPSDLPFTVIGQGEISDVEEGDFLPPPYVEPEYVEPEYVEPEVEVTPEPTKEELLAQIQALATQVQSLP